MDSRLVARSNGLRLKYLNEELVSYKQAAFHFTRHLLMDWVVWVTWGLLRCFYQLFGLSFWRHPFTAEHPLVNIEISSNLFGWESNSSASDGLRVRKCSVKSHFWWTIPLIVMAKMVCESDVSSEKSSNLICLQTALFCYLMQWHSHIWSVQIHL